MYSSSVFLRGRRAPRVFELCVPSVRLSLSLSLSQESFGNVFFLKLAGSEEARRRSLAARRTLERLVLESGPRSEQVLAALCGCIERSGESADACESGAEAVGGWNESEDESEEEQGGPAVPRGGGCASGRGGTTGCTGRLRRAWRALAVSLRVEDSLRPWRVPLGLARAVAGTEQLLLRRQRKPRTRASAEELLRLCKRDAHAREWAQQHATHCAWLEAWTRGEPARLAATTAMGQQPALARDASATAVSMPTDHFGSQLAQQQQSSSTLGTQHTAAACARHERSPPPPPAPAVRASSDDSPSPFGLSLDSFRAPLGVVASAARALSGTQNRPSADPHAADSQQRARHEAEHRLALASRVRALLLRPHSRREELAPYDSDDDPRSLVGRRIRVRWAGNQFYSGTVAKLDEQGHTVAYDDGDSRVYNDILSKTFSLH